MRIRISRKDIQELSPTYSNRKKSRDMEKSIKKNLRTWEENREVCYFEGLVKKGFNRKGNDLLCKMLLKSLVKLELKNVHLI